MARVHGCQCARIMRIDEIGAALVIDGLWLAPPIPKA